MAPKRLLIRKIKEAPSLQNASRAPTQFTNRQHISRHRDFTSENLPVKSDFAGRTFNANFSGTKAKPTFGQFYVRMAIEE